MLVKENDTITQMDVSHNEISDIGGVALAKAVGINAIFIFIHQSISMVDNIKNKINKNTSHIRRTRTQINVQSLQCIRQTD